MTTQRNWYNRPLPKEQFEKERKDIDEYFQWDGGFPAPTDSKVQDASMDLPA